MRKWEECLGFCNVIGALYCESWNGGAVEAA